MSYQSSNPATGKLVKSFDEISDAQFDGKIAMAAQCYEWWRHRNKTLVRTSHMAALV